MPAGRTRRGRRAEKPIDAPKLPASKAVRAMTRLEVGDQVVVVDVMGSGQRSILRCEAANTAAGTSTILAK